MYTAAILLVPFHPLTLLLSILDTTNFKNPRPIAPSRPPALSIKIKEEKAFAPYSHHPPQVA